MIKLKTIERDSDDYWEVNTLINLNNITKIIDYDRSGWAEDFDIIKTEIHFIDQSVVYTKYNLDYLQKKFK